uniref:Uncharacterized protein n=1 Tax=Anopheles stephensi TaxID=30069 RepID=A0A182YSV2_ANOST
MLWEPASDTLRYNIDLKPATATVQLTRRTLLSLIARIYDPLGLAGPVVTLAKVFMQKLWTLRNADGTAFNWDQELPPDIQLLMLFLAGQYGRTPLDKGTTTKMERFRRQQGFKNSGCYEANYVEPCTWTRKSCRLYISRITRNRTPRIRFVVEWTVMVIIISERLASIKLLF